MGCLITISEIGGFTTVEQLGKASFNKAVSGLLSEALILTILVNTLIC